MVSSEKLIILRSLFTCTNMMSDQKVTKHHLKNYPDDKSQTKDYFGSGMIGTEALIRELTV